MPPTKKTFKFVEQGGYGCVFRPEIVCGTNKLGNMKFISKIYRNSDNADSDIRKELYISSIIRKIPNYNSFFVPIMKTCDVNIQEYKRNPMYSGETDKCKFFFDNEDDAQPNNKNEYVSAKMRFISSTLEKQLTFLLNNTIDKQFVRKMAQTFQHLKLGLQKCIKAGFIHYDIKQDNLLYDELIHSPVIIDYGITFLVSKLEDAIHNVEISSLQDIFYTKKFYMYWCIDIYIISQFLHHDYNDSIMTVRNEYLLDEQRVLTKEFLDEKIDNYLNEMAIQSRMPNLSPSLTEDMRKSYSAFYSQFVGKSWFNILKACLKQKWYTSWDYYALCLTYLDLYDNMSSSRQYLKTNKQMQNMVGKWETVLKSTPLARMTV